jgi:hypothetical protein
VAVSQVGLEPDDPEGCETLKVGSKRVSTTQPSMQIIDLSHGEHVRMLSLVTATASASFHRKRPPGRKPGGRFAAPQLAYMHGSGAFIPVSGNNDGLAVEGSLGCGRVNVRQFVERNASGDVDGDLALVDLCDELGQLLAVTVDIKSACVRVVSSICPASPARCRCPLRGTPRGD